MPHPAASELGLHCLNMPPKRVSSLKRVIFLPETLLFDAILQAQTRADYKGPILGPKMAEGQQYDFTEEQLREGKNTVSLQYGSNKGASQAGMNIGKQRMIYD